MLLAVDPGTGESLSDGVSGTTREEKALVTVHLGVGDPNIVP